MKRSVLRTSLLCLLLLAGTGCPHRSPVWSPDGERIVLLAGGAGEEVDKAASQLWLLEVQGGKAKRLKPPEEGLRFLAAAWIEKGAFAVFTGKWLDGYIEVGSEKVWRVDKEGERWKALALPPPAEGRATRRLPVVIGDPQGRALVYPSAEEAVLVANLASGEVLHRLEPAELVGPGPRGGFLVYRPEPSGSGGMELVAFGGDVKPLWQRKFSQIRDEIAAKLKKKPVEVVFNDTSTSHLPMMPSEGKGDPPHDYFGLTVVFSDVGWKEGITGYYLELEAASGKVLSVVGGTGLSGKPMSASGAVWGVTAPDPKRGIPVQLQVLDLKTPKALQTKALEGIKKESVHGYSFDPEGKRFALSLNAPVPLLWIFERGELEKPRELRLE